MPVAKIISSKNRRQPKRVGDVDVHSGNARELNGFKHFRVGNELAVPTTLADGTEVFQTPTGKQYKIKKMSS